jgi:short-subunit dehydrogenase
MGSPESSIDAVKFGPWALVTGASSGIGTEFARQLAAAGLNLVLAARRATLLEEVQSELERDFGIRCRSLQVDLTEDGFVEKVIEATSDLDVGLLVSNAGIGAPQEFLKAERNELIRTVKVNSLAHLELIHHFAPRLAKRQRGGIMLVGALGATIRGLPYLANASASKAYVQAFGESLHEEFRPLGVHVTVLLPGLVDTATYRQFGFHLVSTPMKPLPVEIAVAEGLAALAANRPVQIPGRMNRLIQNLPDSINRNYFSKLMKQLASRPDVGGK